MKIILATLTTLSLLAVISSLLYIQFKNPNAKYKKYAKALAACSFIVFLMFSASYKSRYVADKHDPDIHTSREQSVKQVSPKQQKEQFLKFYDNYMGHIYEYSMLCKKYDKNMNLVADGQISIYEAYESMKALEAATYGLRDRVSKMENGIPEGLPDECHGKIVEGLDNLDKSFIMRIGALRKTKEGFNESNFKPETISEIKSDLQYSLGKYQLSMANMAEAGNVLGVIDKMEEIRKGYEFE